MGFDLRQSSRKLERGMVDCLLAFQLVAETGLSGDLPPYGGNAGIRVAMVVESVLQS
jgi:hypothetical protein